MIPLLCTIKHAVQRYYLDDSSSPAFTMLLLLIITVCLTAISLHSAMNQSVPPIHHHVFQQSHLLCCKKGNK